MITSNLRIDRLSEATSHWYVSEYLAAMDALDLERYAAHLTSDVEMSFNNGPAVTGKAAVVAMLGDYWKSFASLEHDLLNIYGDDRAFALEALNHYRTHDGRRVTTRAVAFTDRGPDGLVTSVRIYADTSPIFA